MPDERTWLENNSTIKLYRINGDGEVTITIDEPLNGTEENSCGGSVLAYKAKKENIMGILKEFYPLEEMSNMALKRDDENGLILSANNPIEQCKANFLAKRNAFRSSYDLLYEKTKRYPHLIQLFYEFELYTNMQDNDAIGLGTLYVWSREIPVEPFSNIIDNVKNNPTKDKINDCLRTLSTFIDYIHGLHCAGLVHCDIKPENFGCMRIYNNVYAENITLFDINTIADIKDANRQLCGTNGYMPPELINEGVLPNVSSDIYSIGAMIFNTLIDKQEENGKYISYGEELYDNIKEYVKDSKLIHSDDMAYYVNKVLQKALNPNKNNRYGDCEQLKEDFIKIIKALNGESEKEQTKEARQAENNARHLAIMYHLYKYPLYETANENDNELNVLLYGFNEYGKCFLHECLQLGQMMGRKLNVYVLDKDDDNCAKYMFSCPKMSKFFNINCAGNADAYGNIYFIQVNTKYDLNNTLNKLWTENKNPDYVFLAENKKEEVRYYIHDKFPTASLNLIRDDDYVFEGNVHCLNPNNLDSKLIDELERMAFNLHLIWDKNLLKSYGEQYDDIFKNNYNKCSSLSSAISIKYKLHDVGIELRETEFEECARKFTEKINCPNGNKIVTELMYLEHCRWNVEKIYDGWDTLNLNDCIRLRNNKDKANKLHACILSGRCDNILASEFSRDMWDTAGDEELARLDELDRLSVDLHRLYAQKAEEIKNENSLFRRIETLKTTLNNNCSVIPAFNEWYSCAVDILNGDTEKCNLYVGLYQQLKQALLSLDGGVCNDAEQCLDGIDSDFYYIRAALEYKDWKSVDSDIVLNIPTILTYRHKVCMIIPFKVCVDDNNVINPDKCFKNIAAATLYNPEKLIFLCDACDIGALEKSLKAVANVVASKNIRASIMICIHGDRAITKAEFGPEGNDRFLHPICFTSYADLRSVLNSVATGEQNGKYTYIIEKDKSLPAELYNEFGSFRFNSDKMKFEDIEGDAEFLKYVNKTPYITISDVVNVGGNLKKWDIQPQFFSDYKQLWECFLEYRDVWKELCDSLNKYCRNFDKIAVLHCNGANKQLRRFPYHCSQRNIEVVRFLLGELKDRHTISESIINQQGIGNYDVNIESSDDNKDTLDSLFGALTSLYSLDDVYFGVDERGNCVVSRDNLSYIGYESSNDRVKKAINAFSAMNYIVDLHESDDNKLSFAFAMKQVKEFLLYPERLAEIYAYHSIKSSGKLCNVDVACVDIADQTSACLATRGFRTYVIVFAGACSDVSEIETLCAKAEMCGINPCIILVGTGNLITVDKCNKNVVLMSDFDELKNIVEIISK